MNDHEFQRDLASYEQEQSFLKHLTSLSTGSIIIIVAFLEKIFNNPEWKYLVGISIVLFLVSIIGCVIAHLLSVLEVDQPVEKRMSKPVLIGFSISTPMAFGGFLGGIICFGIFAIKNL